MRKPNLFIVGHPRTGTSSLHYYLNQHPDIFMTSVKEPNYFALDFRKESDSFHGKELYFPFRTEEQYLKLYRKWSGEKIAGEASATNLCSKVSAGTISDFNANAKIIMMFREPVGFLHSHHSTAVFSLGETHKVFNTALSAEQGRRQGKDLSKRVIVPSWLFYSDFVKYADQIHRYLSCFDSDQIKIIIFDDFKENTLETFRDVLDFLDVAGDFTPQFDIVNPNKKLKWPILKRLIMDSPFFRKTLRLLFSHDMYTAMTRLYMDRIVTYGSRDPLDEGFRRRLMLSYKEEVEKFSELLGRDLITLWGYDKL